MVRHPRLVAAPASAGDARPRARARHAAHRADGRRQDAGGVPAHARRSRGRRSRGAAHALCLAAQGAGGGYTAQPHRPGDRDGAAHPGRGPHRRHLVPCQAPAARRSAAYPPDHAREPRADDLLRGRAAALCRAQSVLWWTRSTPSPRASAAISSCSRWRGCRRSAPGCAAWVSRPRSRIRPRWRGFSGRAARPARC